MSSTYGQRVPAPASALQRDDPEERLAAIQKAKLDPLAAKVARGEQLTPYEQGAARAVAMGRGPRHLAQQADALLQPYQRGGTTGQGLTEAQVKRAIDQALQPVLDQIRDLARDLED